MRRMLPVICFTLCVIPALAQKAGKEGKAMTDQQFVDFAAQTDMVEANLGQLVQTTSSPQSVMDYGQMLVTDHTNDYHQLYSAAHEANLNVPTAIDAKNNKTMIDPFEKLKGEGFAHRYIADMVSGHDKAIAIYKKEAADAENPAIKSYAQAALPTLEKHLDDAKNLEKRPEKKG